MYVALVGGASEAPLVIGLSGESVPFAVSDGTTGADSPGTSRLALAPGAGLGVLAWSVLAVGEVWIGNLVSGPPDERSLR